MEIAGIILNDIANCPGIGISIYVQYCPHHCKNCHNPETWSKDGGQYVDNDELLKVILNELNKNGIKRDINLLGGEPLCKENIKDELYFINKIKEKSPQTKIYLWTGYTFEQLIERAFYEKEIDEILSKIDVLIDGPYIEEQRDITLKMRGSKNQRIIYLNEKGN